MGIWVRSQDGNVLVLIKVFSTGLNSNRKEPACVFGRADAIDRLGLPLGNYATEKEAKQVLDNIQRFISENEYCKYNGNIGYPIFEMPPAGFSAVFIPDCGSDFCGLINPETNDTKPGDHCGDYEICKAAWERGCR